MLVIFIHALAHFPLTHRRKRRVPLRLASRVTAGSTSLAVACPHESNDNARATWSDSSVMAPERVRENS
jgi:hypothetical protein